MKKGILILAVFSILCFPSKAQDYSPFFLDHEWIFDIYEEGVIAGTDTMRCEEIVVSGDTTFYYVYNYLDYIDERPVGDPELNLFYDGVGDLNNVYVKSILDLLYFKHMYTDGESYINLQFSVSPHFIGDYQLPSGELYTDCFWLDFNVNDSTGFIVAPDIGVIAAFELGSLVRALRSSNLPPVSYDDFDLCEGDSILIHDRFVKDAGVYRDTLTGSDLKDSIVVSTISILQPSLNTMEITICEGDSYYAQGAEQTESGVYYDTLVNAAGCDSVIITNLTVSLGSENTLDMSICEGDSYYAQGAEQTESGVYYDTLVNAAGCDSVIITNLTVSMGSENTLDMSICEGDSYYAQGAEQTESGVYNDTLVNAAGCDSVIITNLSIDVCETSVPAEEASSAIRVYPNPTSGLITIDSGTLDYFEVYNLLGMKVYRSEKQSFDFSALSEGYYYVKCFDLDGQFTVFKVIYAVNH